MTEPELDIINQLITTLSIYRKTNLEVQKKLILESQETNRIYTDILHELRRQNLILQEHKHIEVSN